MKLVDRLFLLVIALLSVHSRATENENEQQQQESVGDASESSQCTAEQFSVVIIARRVLELFDARFDNQASKNIVRYKVENWSNNPNTRGAVSSWGFDEPGSQNVRNKVWIAGEAFPIDGQHNSWVDAGAFSGDDAAKQILELHYGISDDEWFWHKVARDLGR